MTYKELIQYVSGLVSEQGQDNEITDEHAQDIIANLHFDQE